MPPAPPPPATADEVPILEERYQRLLHLFEDAGIGEISLLATEEIKDPKTTFLVMEQAIEKLRPWRDAGAGYAIGYFPDAAYDGSSMDLFAKAVMPNL